MDSHVERLSADPSSVGAARRSSVANCTKPAWKR
jgi:hypothetical protein